MTTVTCIVEGHGEVSALPVLLRRISEWLTPGVYPEIGIPIRVHRDQFLHRPDERTRKLQLAGLKSGENGWILILLDADDDCPVQLARTLHEEAQATLPKHRLSVVLANREFEAWFIAASSSLNGVRGFAQTEPQPDNSEQIRNAKGWLSRQIRQGSYQETTDQAAFSARMDLQLAHQASRSFRKLCAEWCTCNT